jgi:hypothetical protein
MGDGSEHHPMTRYDLKRWLRASLQPATYLGLTMLVLVWGTIFLKIHEERERAYADAARETSNFARVFEEHVFRTIKSIDQTLLFLRELYRRDPSNVGLINWVIDSKLHNDQTLQLSVANSKGDVIASNFPLHGEVDVSNREHFQVHIHETTDELFISKPVD